MPSLQITISVQYKKENSQKYQMYSALSGSTTDLCKHGNGLITSPLVWLLSHNRKPNSNQNLIRSCPLEVINCLNHRRMYAAINQYLKLQNYIYWNNFSLDAEKMPPVFKSGHYMSTTSIGKRMSKKRVELFALMCFFEIKID